MSRALFPDTTTQCSPARCHSFEVKKGQIRTNIDAALGDHGAVGLVHDAADLLEVIRVREDLVVGDDVLSSKKKERAGSAKRSLKIQPMLQAPVHWVCA